MPLPPIFDTAQRRVAVTFESVVYANAATVLCVRAYVPQKKKKKPTKTRKQKMADVSGENAGWWREFMMTDEAQEALKAQREEEVEEAIEEYEAVRKPKEMEELAAALLECSVEVKELVAPLLKHDFAQRILYDALRECRKIGRDFSGYVSGSAELRPYLEKCSEEVRADPARGLALNESWWASVRQAARQDFEKNKVVPPELTGDETINAMNSASMLLTLGRKKIIEKRFVKALEYFSQGTSALKNVFLRRPDDESVSDLYAKLLSNKAMAALKLDKYTLCIEACDTIIGVVPLPEKDDVILPKALYRRGIAHKKKGNLQEAHNSFKAAIDYLPQQDDQQPETTLMLRDLQKQIQKLHYTKLKAKNFDNTMIARWKSNDNTQKSPPVVVSSSRKKTEINPLEQNVDAVLAFQERQLKVFQAARAPTLQTDTVYNSFRRNLRSAQIALLPAFGLPATVQGLDAADRAIGLWLHDARVRANANKMLQALTDNKVIDDVFSPQK